MTREELAKFIHKKMQQIECARAGDPIDDIWEWGEGPEHMLDTAEQLADNILGAFKKELP